MGCETVEAECVEAGEAGVKTVGVAAALVALLTAIVMARSLWVGIVPGRWPAPPIARSDHPIMFWLGIGGYSIAVIVGTIFAATLLG